MESSGAQVQKEAIVMAITILGILKSLAKEETLSTKRFEHIISNTKPKINVKMLKIILSPLPISFI